MLIILTLIVWLITSIAIYSYRKPTSIKWFFASVFGFLLGMIFYGYCFVYTPSSRGVLEIIFGVIGAIIFTTFLKKTLWKEGFKPKPKSPKETDILDDDFFSK